MPQASQRVAGQSGVLWRHLYSREAYSHNSKLRPSPPETGDPGGGNQPTPPADSSALGFPGLTAGTRLCVGPSTCGGRLLHHSSRWRQGLGCPLSCFFKVFLGNTHSLKTLSCFRTANLTNLYHASWQAVKEKAQWPTAICSPAIRRLWGNFYSKSSTF